MVQKVIEKVKFSFVTAGIFGLGFLLYYLICLGSYQSYAESLPVLPIKNNQVSH